MELVRPEALKRKTDFDFFGEEQTNSPKTPSTTDSNNPKIREDYSKIFTEKSFQPQFEEPKVVEVVMEGFLIKQGSQWKSWKKRFFTLKSDGTLIYKEKFQDKNPIKILNITGCKLSTNPPEKKKFNCFKIEFPTQTDLYFQAMSEQDFDAWRKSFLQCGCHTEEKQIDSSIDKVILYKSIEVSKQKVILPQQLNIGKKIGEGAQGTVYLVELDNIPNVQLSIKIFPKKLLTGLNDLTQCINEITILDSVPEHKNVIKFYGVCEFPDTIGIVFEYCPNGNLIDFISKRKGFVNKTEKIQILLDIANGLHHLHKNNIMHRDIKCDNILVSDDYIVKLIDFGLAAKNNKKKKLSMKVGTAVYCAPEVISTTNYTEKCDVFSFGIIMWILAHENENPYGEDLFESEILSNIQNDEQFRPKIDEKKVEKGYQRLMMLCWSQSPSLRPSFSSVIDTLKSLK
eukprot:gene9206-1292_t